MVKAPPGESWTLSIDTLLSAGLTVESAIFDPAPNLAFLNLFYSGDPLTDGDLTLGGGSLIAPSALSTSVLQFASAAVTDVGTGSFQLVALRFLVPASATVQATKSHFRAQAASVQLGLPGGVEDAVTDDYPGLGDRSTVEDGHFVTLSFVPEPSRAMLEASGLVALAIFTLSRRDRRPKSRGT